jgi:hypothetical protein
MLPNLRQIQIAVFLMCSPVTLVRRYVSEEIIASIMRAKRISELGKR